MYRAVTAVGIVGVGVLLAACGGAKTTTTETTETTAGAPATGTAPAPAPVAESALDGLLLSPAEIDTATGLTGMAVAATARALATDIELPADAAPEKLACVGLAGTAEAQAYAGAGSTAVRDQVLQSPGDNGAARTAGQSVILFDSADRASAFVAGSTDKWRACRQFSGAGSTSTVGPVSATDGVLNTTFTTTNRSGAAVECQRALTAQNNTVVEASACGAAAPNAAVQIARGVAANIAGS